MEQVYFNVKELGLKERSKAEIYRLLTVEGQLFLPQLQKLRYNSLRDHQR